MFRRAANNAYLMLLATTLMWSANGMASRMAVGEVSPMAIVSLRWLIAGLILITFAHRQILADWQILKHHPVLMLFGGAVGFTGFNSLFYIAAHTTSAVNMTLLQGSIPIFVLIGSALLYRLTVSPLQWIGVMLTILGVMVVAAKGSFETLKSLTFNIGDIWLILACSLYALYALRLRNRPKVSGIGFFSVMAIIAFLASLPLLGIESQFGTLQWPTPKGWVILAFIALFPSLLAQLTFLRAVDLIGPSRASIFTNLVPIFGPALAVLTLGEEFHLFHAASLVLVLGGITLAEWKRGEAI